MSFTSGNVLVLSGFGDQVSREYNKNTGAFVASYSAGIQDLARRSAFTANGLLGSADSHGGSSSDELDIYNSTPAVLSTTSFTANSTVGTSVGQDGKFYVSLGNTFKRYDQSGSLEFTSGLLSLAAGSTPVGMGSNAVGTLAYYADRTGKRIRSWNVPGNTFGSDIVSGLPTAFLMMQQFADGSFLILDGATNPVIRRYSEAGALIGSYTSPELLSGNEHYIAVDKGDSSFFWLGIYKNDFFQDFRKIDSTTMSVLTSWSIDWSGMGFPDPSVFVVVPTAAGPTPPTPVTPQIISTVPECDPGTTAAGNVTGPLLPAIDPAWTASCPGGGEVPTAAPVVDAEVWDT